MLYLNNYYYLLRSQETTFKSLQFCTYVLKLKSLIVPQAKLCTSPSRGHNILQHLPLDVFYLSSNEKRFRDNPMSPSKRSGRQYDL
ncbi:hypothetical protein C0J52_28417 [Blattella germanica]|nr:hypothetical protein C0J52_28417 [Blattella germanica]